MSKIGDAVLRVFQTPEWSHMGTVAYGECELLDAIASEAGFPSMHPLNRHKRVLDALDRDPRFEKFKFRCWLGNREGLARGYRRHGFLNEKTLTCEKCLVPVPDNKACSDCGDALCENHHYTDEGIVFCFECFAVRQEEYQRESALEKE